MDRDFRAAGDDRLGGLVGGELHNTCRRKALHVGLIFGEREHLKRRCIDPCASADLRAGQRVQLKIGEREGNLAFAAKVGSCARREQHASICLDASVDPDLCGEACLLDLIALQGSLRSQQHVAGSGERLTRRQQDGFGIDE